VFNPQEDYYEQSSSEIWAACCECIQVRERGKKAIDYIRGKAIYLRGKAIRDSFPAPTLCTSLPLGSHY